MNRICITGNLTKDIQVRYTPNNIAVASFSLGVKRDFKNSDGEYESDFPNCIAYRQTAEYLGKYAKKGDKIEIEGRIQTRTYEKDGKTQYITEIVVDRGSLLSYIKQEEPKEEPKEESNPFEEFGNEHAEQEEMPF